MKIINTIILITCAAIIGIVSSGCTPAQKLKRTLSQLDDNRAKIEQACDIAVAIGSFAEKEQLSSAGEKCQFALEKLSDAEKTTAGKMVLCVVRDNPIEQCANEVDWIPVGQKIRKSLE